MPELPVSPCSEACERNRGPILEVLRDHFAERQRVLEIGSGTGQHAAHFAAALPRLIWQTSDLESNLPGIRSWLEGLDLPNLPPPIALDVTGAWPETRFDAIFTANTLHIMGWPEVRTLFAALPKVLTADAMLVVYGPFNYDGRFTSPSNAAFDEWLKQRSPHSGIRDFAAVDELARSSGFALIEDRPMPANNRTLVWRRAGVRRRKRHYIKKTLATLLAALTGSFCVSPTHASDLRQQVDAYRATHEKDIVTQLDALTRLPSVAARPQALAATADRLEYELRIRGFETIQFIAKGGSPPAVFGFYHVHGAKRTVVFYAHYDGQPVTPSQWASDPFGPVMRDGPLSPTAKAVDWRHAKTPLDPDWRLFGRAAADDKASIIAFLAAFDALRALHRAPSVNLKVLWEGEEEAGSPHLAAILQDHAAQLRSDLLLIGDGPVHQSDAPTLYFGARGAMGLDLTIYGPLHPLHDGHYGNWVPNAAVMAAELIASMRDSNGRILIPGFYHDVRSLTAADRAAIAKLPPVENTLRREFGIGRTEGNAGLSASVMGPALNIRGISSGAVGAAANNAIPTQADISIDFRLVPDQTPEHVRMEVERFLTAKGWTLVSAAPDLDTRLSHSRIIRVGWSSGYPGLRTDLDTPAARALITSAHDAAGGRLALVPMMGGSVPLSLFHHILGVPVIILPIVNHDDSQHAPNENLRLKNLWDGIDVYAAEMAELDW
jgi:acetylornithine deacetylase/succinyl-diaminopimelate desuccinylase-like protein